MDNKLRASKAAVICYGFGDLASQFVWTFVGSYLTIFYSDVVGLTPLAISIIMMVARIWDAVNDPMMGAIAERTHSRWGRFRPYIAFGAPLLAITSVLTFTNPFKGTSTAGVIYAAVTYILAGMIYTMTNIPYGAMAAVMSEDSNQRNQINASRNIGMNLGMTIVNALSPILLMKFSHAGAEAADSKGYLWTVIIYAIISVPMFLVVFFSSREVVQPSAEARARKFSFVEIIKNLVTNKYLMIISAIMAVQMTAFMGRIAVTPFWVIYDLGSFTMISLIMTIPTVVGIFTSLLVPAFAKKFGKRNVLMTTLIVQGICLVGLYLAPFDNITLIIAIDVVFGIFNVGMPMTLSMVADSVDYMEEKAGVRTDGTAYATYGLATKLGNAIGGAFGIVIMSAFGYVANQQQTPQAMKGINFTVNLLPAILYFVAAALCLLWNMSDKDADDIRARLINRNRNQG